RSHKEGRPWTNAPTWDHKEDRRRLHRKPGVVAEPSTVREEVDGMSRCPPGKPGESDSPIRGGGCSGRNNTDLVGVTWPRAGAQKSRVGQEQYPRIAGQIAIWASGGSDPGSERPPAAPQSIVFLETMASAPYWRR
ncbi:conserved hypothetical protein, partial [Trichinella spiralis]|uniref:hypothetical protein n=1 Tax=Trichinella spiralis TaxID=6334 RepID=UPI0001EFDD2C